MQFAKKTGHKYNLQNIKKNMHDTRLWKREMLSEAAPDQILALHERLYVFFLFFFCLQVWNVSTFRGTRWFPRRPPPLRCPSPRKPERSGPAGGQRDAGAPDKGRLRLLSTARTPRCSRDCSDLSGHTQQQKKKNPNTFIRAVWGEENAARDTLTDWKLRRHHHLLITGK